MGRKFIWSTTRTGPLLFNIFLCDLFWIMCETDFASFADDNTPYALGDGIDDVIKSIESK